MVRIEQARDELRATDAAKRSVTVTGEFAPVRDAPSLDRAVDDRTAVYASTVRFDQAYVVAENLDEGTRIELASDAGPIVLPDAAHCVRVATPVKAYLRFDGPATISKPGFDAVVIEFPARTRVSIGFRSQTDHPRESLTIPRTVDGVARALTAMATSHRTASPDRSFPSMRNHPPTVEFGDEVDLPASVTDPTFPGERPRIVVPPDLGTLLCASPLVHYTGASVRVEPGASTTLIADGEWVLGDGAGGASRDGVGAVSPDGGMDADSAEARVDADAADGSVDAGTPHGDVNVDGPGGEVGDGPPREGGDVESAIAATLRRIFYLDCLVRNAGPHGTDLAEDALLEAVDLDAADLYGLPMAKRIGRYMDAEYERIADGLPEWHLSMYLAPDFESVRSLPYLLSNVPQVFRPRSETLDGSEWLSRSLDDFFRGRDSVSVTLSKPALRTGRTHGWLAADTPIDVFKALPEAYRNRERFYDRADERISIVAVVNDPEMAPEGTAAADIYRRRAAELDIDVTVRERLERDELAAVFERSHDLVHFIGHCEPDGLVCPDGHLSAADVAESNAQTFFLNACGSYYEGVELIRKGSVAGGVTFNRVLDNNAALVGTAFARLLVNGFAFEQAIKLARRRVMAGKDYVVVGDGTHELTQKEGLITTHLEVERHDDGYLVVHDAYKPTDHGAVYQSHLQTESVSQLYGTRQEFVVDGARLREFLELATIPIVYDGDLHWSTELKETL